MEDRRNDGIKAIQVFAVVSALSLAFLSVAASAIYRATHPHVESPAVFKLKIGSAPEPK